VENVENFTPEKKIYILETTTYSFCEGKKNRKYSI